VRSYYPQPATGGDPRRAFESRLPLHVSNNLESPTSSGFTFTLQRKGLGTEAFLANYKAHETLLGSVLLLTYQRSVGILPLAMLKEANADAII